MNITSQNNSYDYNYITSNYSNITSSYNNIPSNNYDYSDYYDYYDPYDDEFKLLVIMIQLRYVIIAVGLFSTPIAIYALYSQVRNDHVAPIYVINLLISDIIQFCYMIVEVVPLADLIIDICNRIYYFALMVSVGFMVCIALERYLVIAHPLWYRCRRTIKSSVVVCVLVWVVPVVPVLTFILWVESLYLNIIFSIILLFPLPLFIFFLVGVLKALSASISVPSDEKRRIVAVLVLVMLIYTLLFLPSIVMFLSTFTRYNSHYDYDYDYNDSALSFLPYILYRLSPLADLLLYVFMRKGIIDKFLSSVCCCRTESDDTNSSSV